VAGLKKMLYGKEKKSIFQKKTDFGTEKIFYRKRPYSGVQ
jgi:hypothetical protein